MPMVISPEKSKFGQSCFTCFARCTHSAGSTPDFAVQLKVQPYWCTRISNDKKPQIIFRSAANVTNTCSTAMNKVINWLEIFVGSEGGRDKVKVWDLHSSPLVLTCTKTRRGCLPTPLTARSKWFATCCKNLTEWPPSKKKAYDQRKVEAPAK
jgi:hypothetical protein